MTKGDDAYSIFMGRFTCSAAVLSAFSEELGLETGMAKKIACGFGAGISKTGNICGAVSGGIMAIGLKYGKAMADDDAATEKTRALVRKFIMEFTERNGSVNCTELLGYDLSDPKDYPAAAKSGIFVTKCPLLVRDAADIIGKIFLADENQSR